MAHASPSRRGRYRKPIALSIAIAGLGLVLSATVSQVLMKDPEMFAAITSGAESVGRKVAEMKGHTVSQPAGEEVAVAPVAAVKVTNVANVSSDPEVQIKRHAEDWTGWSYKRIVLSDQ